VASAKEGACPFFCVDEEKRFNPARYATEGDWGRKFAKPMGGYLIRRLPE
jgi:hypothetical protein